MSFRLTAATELMKNQKAAQVVADQSEFQVLQTATGHALFFSVGDDGIMHVSVEQEEAATGWTPIDLTTEVGALLGGKSVTAKTFAVSQDSETGDILVAQAVTVAEDKTDALVLLSGLSNDDGAAWLGSSADRQWLTRAYDDEAHPAAALDIEYLDCPVDQDQAGIPYVLVGLAQQNSYVQNYLVATNATASPVWNRYETAENYDQLQDIALGRPQGAMFAGLYELYSLGSETALTFTPLKGAFGPPDVTKLTPPPGASSVAVLPADGGTNLYVAGQGGIYLYPAGSQTNFAEGIAVVSDGVISDVTYLDAHLAGTVVTVWGRNASGAIFYARGDAGNQTDATAWSAPIPIEQGVEQLATALDRTTGASSSTLTQAGLR